MCEILFEYREELCSVTICALHVYHTPIHTSTHTHTHTPLQLDAHNASTHFTHLHVYAEHTYSKTSEQGSLMLHLVL